MSGISQFGSFNIDEKTGRVQMYRKSAGVDPGEMAQKMAEIKRLPIKKQELKINENTEKIAALKTFEEKVQAFREASHALRSGKDLMGISGALGQYNTTASSSGSTPAEKILVASVESEASLKQFTVTVDQLASYDLSMGTVGVNSRDTALGWSGTLTLNGEDTTITADMTLDEVKVALNDSSPNSHIKTSIIKHSDTDFRLSFQSTNLGEPMSIINSTDAPNGLIPADTGKTVSDLSALFSFNGENMSRLTNHITDVTDGVELFLNSASPTENVTVEVKENIGAALDAIDNFVTSFNDLNKFVEEQKKFNPETGEHEETAILKNHPALRLIHDLKYRLSMAATGVPSDNLNTLADIGISMTTEGLQIDYDQRDKLAFSKFEEIKQLFDFSSQVPGEYFSLIGHPVQLDPDLGEHTTTVTVHKDAEGALSGVDLVVNGGVYAGKTFSINASDLVTQGNWLKIEGKYAKNSDVPTAKIFDGLNLAYLDISKIPDGESDSSTLTLSQGIADILYQETDQILDPIKGDFTLYRQQLVEKNSRAEEEISKIEARAEKYREVNERKLERMQALMAVAEQNLGQIKMFVDAWNKD